MSSMNRRRTRNDSISTNSRKEFRPISRDSNTYKQIKHHEPESDLNFNVSSSGTNLKRKIEQEMAKLENMDKKSRGNKYRTKPPISTNKPQIMGSEQQKFKFLLNMLATMDTVKSKRKPPNAKKAKVNAEVDAKKTMKTKKNVINNVAIESLAELNELKRPPEIFAKAEMQKRRMKKNFTRPFSAPMRNVNSEDDSEFEENLKFGISTREIFKNSRNELKTIVEVISRDDWSQESTMNLSFQKNKVFNALLSNKTKFKEVEDVKVSNGKKNQDNRLKYTNTIEPESKKSSSFLRRGNFTLASHFGSVISDSSEQTETYCNEKNQKEYNKIDTLALKNNTLTDSLIKIEKSRDYLDEKNVELTSKQTFVDEKSELERLMKTYNEIFPTELLERSISAVEKVLQTIESMTKNLNVIEEDEPQEEASMKTEMIDFRKIMDEIDRPKELRTSSIKTIFRRIEKSPPGKYHEEEVLYLKTPIQSFLESQREIAFEKKIDNTDAQRIIEKIKNFNDEEKQDPLTKALNVLKAKVTNMREEKENRGDSYDNFISEYSFVSLRLNERFNDENGMETVKKKHSVARKVKMDSGKSSVVSYDDSFVSFQCSTPFSSNFSSISHNHTSNVSSNKTYSHCRTKSFNNRNYNIKKFDFEKILRKTARYERKETFPERNFEKCLMLLKKTFRDFENMRRNRELNSILRNNNGDVPMIGSDKRNTTYERQCSAQFRQRNAPDVTYFGQQTCAYQPPTQHYENNTIKPNKMDDEWIKINDNCVRYENKNFHDQTETSCDSFMRNIEDDGIDGAFDQEREGFEMEKRRTHNVFGTKSCPR